jgi:hypothetical protein
MYFVLAQEHHHSVGKRGKSESTKKRSTKVILRERSRRIENRPNKLQENTTITITKRVKKKNRKNDDTRPAWHPFVIPPFFLYTPRFTLLVHRENVGTASK